MKKRSSSRQNPKSAVKAKRAKQSVTIGMDLGDKTSRYCLLNDEGEILREGQVATTKAGMTGTFGRQTLARLARIDPQLLRPIQHRSEKAQTALMVIRVTSGSDSGADQLGEHGAGACQGVARAIAKV